MRSIIGTLSKDPIRFVINVLAIIGAISALTGFSDTIIELKGALKDLATAYDFLWRQQILRMLSYLNAGFSPRLLDYCTVVLVLHAVSSINNQTTIFHATLRGAIVYSRIARRGTARIVGTFIGIPLTFLLLFVMTIMEPILQAIVLLLPYRVVKGFVAALWANFTGDKIKDGVHRQIWLAVRQSAKTYYSIMFLVVFSTSILLLAQFAWIYGSA